MVRRLFKVGLASGWCWSGVSSLKRALGGGPGMPWIVTYHRVVEDFDRSAQTSLAAMLTSRRMFERHIDWIAAHFDCLSLDEIGTRLQNGLGFQRPAASVTFDDGYSDVYHHAFPILRKKGIPAAVFVVSSQVGTPKVPVHDRLHLLLGRAGAISGDPVGVLERALSAAGIASSGLDRSVGEAPDRHARLRLLLENLPHSNLECLVAALEEEVGVAQDDLAELCPLTWEMLAEMHRADITIGSHTRTHPLLTRERKDRVLDETAGSRRELSARLGCDVHHFAYPNGWFDTSTVDAVADAGYRWAYTSCRHRDPSHPLLTLPRSLLWECSALGLLGDFSPAVMSGQAEGLFERASGCRLNHWI